MGCGQHVCLVWGTKDEAAAAWLKNEEWEQATGLWRDEIRANLRVQLSIEGEKWAGVVAACSDRDVRDCMTFLAFPLEPNPDYATLYADVLAKARTNWDRFRDLAAKHGFGLPEGEMLLVSDYD